LRILFVAMSDSVHTARWINQLEGQGWDIHLFPSIDIGYVNPDLRNTIVHHSFYRKQKVHVQTTRFKGIPIVTPPISEQVAYVFRMALQRKIWAEYRLYQLRKLIKRLKPDIIHSLEFQSGAYLVSDVKKSYVGQFPPWIATNWGSDIYLFGRLAEHINKIKDVLEKCDYYSCECQRDVMLARQLGFKGKVLPVLPNTGGFDIERAAQLRQPGAASGRRLILLKGYQHWAGRALVGLRALALCADSLKDYRVAIPLAGDDVKIAAELVSQTTGIPIEIIPRCSHEEMLRRYGQARISIGLSISDAISTSLLEAMVMGAFPIQSCTACCDEWIDDGVTGLIVPPEDPETIAAAIRKAVSDDNMVDRSAELNAKTARERLNQAIIKPQVIAMYQQIASELSNKRK
jgi:glycosyltransferase involved in cell wall biosynthesis